MNSVVNKCAHSMQMVSHICLAKDCDESYLCENCLLNHNGLHFAYVQKLTEAMNFDPIPKVVEIKGLLAEKLSFRQKIDKSYEDALERIKSDIQQIFDKAKAAVSEKGIMKEVKNVASIEALANDISNLKKEFSELDNPKSDPGMILLNNYLDKFRDFHKKSSTSADNLKKTRISSVSYKELDEQVHAIMNAVERALQVVEKAYYGDELGPENEEKVNIEILQPAKIASKIDITQLQKETDLKLTAAPGWNTIEYIDSANAIVIGNDLGNLELWDASSLKRLSVQKYHSDYVNAIKYYKKLDFFCTASNDTTIKVLKVKTVPIIDTVATLTGHTDKVWSLYIVEDHDIMYSSGKEATIIGWDLQTLTIKHKFDTRGRDTTGTEMTYIPRLKILVVSFKQGTIGLFNIETPQEVLSLKVYQKWLHAMTYIESRDELIVGTDVGTIKVWKVANHEFNPIKTYKVPGNIPLSVAAINGGNELLVASEHQRLASLNLDTEECMTSEDLGLNKVATFRLLPAIQKLVLTSDEIDVAVAKY